MSDGKDEIKAPEIVIIRRGHGGHDEGHHGGAWKIAYADFMTAMMAFFLVMWLVNSTDKETLTQVATYFNPIKLTDRSTSAKGLQNPDEGAVGKLEHAPAASSDDSMVAEKGSEAKKSEDKKGKKAKKDKKEEKKGAESAKKAGSADKTVQKEQPPQTSIAQETEAALFADPYKSLDALAQQARAAGARKASTGGNEGEASGEGAGAVFRDPFDPNYWRTTKTKPANRGEPLPDTAGLAEKDVGQADAANPRVDDSAKDTGRTFGDVADRPARGDAAPANEPVKEAIKEAKAEQPTPATANSLSEPANQAAPGGGKGAGNGGAANDAKDVQQLLAAIQKALGQPAPGQVPHIEVTATSEGLLVSLTDEFDFGMFTVGSASPRPELVLVMEKIAGVLKSRSEAIVVRGHTDGRPYRSQLYDNWRLSTARAHMAAYMLVRGGIPEARVERIEGYADRKLKLPNEPEAAENRRIEILLRTQKP